MVLDKEKVKLEAKKIIDNFIKELGNIKLEKDFKLIRDKNLRDEDKSKKEIENNDFNIRFLNNAPKKYGDYVLSKKGKWVK